MQEADASYVPLLRLTIAPKGMVRSTMTVTFGTNRTSAISCAVVLSLTLTLLSGAVAAAEGASARIVVQNAPLAGFVYYDGKDVWDRMKRGDRLVLVREPANPHDPNAVRIEWQGHMLGYVPRRDNIDLARQMDFGARVDGRITELNRAANGRHRISYEISVPLK